MKTRQEVLAQQKRWAQTQGLHPDSRGYLASYEANLFQPLSNAALLAFSSGSGNELRGSADRPAKMSALHSSSALAVNVFDYWAAQSELILTALGLRTGGVSLHFEKQFPTGLDGNPPNLDVAIRWADGTWLGIESKFTEWLTPKPPTKEHFKPKYFPGNKPLWGAWGHDRCQKLAMLISSGQTPYRYLDAPQLLKHALGLACTGSEFELMYIYFDVPGPESELHKSEIEDFAGRIAGDFPFHVRRYQELYERLSMAAAPPHAAYLQYLRTRYFPASPAA